MSAGALHGFTFRAQELDDHAVVHEACGETVCTAEDGDTIALLVAVAASHLEECAQRWR